MMPKLMDLKIDEEQKLVQNNKRGLILTTGAIKRRKPGIFMVSREPINIIIQWNGETRTAQYYSDGLID